jgi:hypothetical protein
MLRKILLAFIKTNSATELKTKKYFSVNLFHFVANKFRELVILKSLFCLQIWGTISVQVLPVFLKRDSLTKKLKR